MIGDTPDMQRRLMAMLPTGWFGETPPVLMQLLSALGSGLAAFWALLQGVIGETRIATADGSFLDLASTDFFGTTLPRFPGELDNNYRVRLTQEMLRPRGTRAALTLGLQQLTGRAPVIFEPARTSDTGGYSAGGVGYNVGGGWGNLTLPFQFFVRAFRPSGGGISHLAGYGTGGVPVYGSLTMETNEISDLVIQMAIRPLLPAATTAWMSISS